MLEISGNFWKEAERNKYDALVCTTNLELNSRNELIMGAGIAKGFKTNFPRLPAEWGLQLIVDNVCDVFAEENQWSRLFVSTSRLTGQFLIGLPTKIKWKNNSTTSLVAQSLTNLMVFADRMKLRGVLMTRPGCGLGGLSWEKTVRPMMAKMDDRFTVIENAVRKKKC